MSSSPGEHDPADFERRRLQIYALEDGAVRAAALSFCLRSGFFEHLEARPRAVTELSQDLGLHERVLPTLLAFLCSQELVLRRPDGRFANTPATSAFLVRGSERYVGARGLLFAGFHEAVGHLEESLASGRPWTEAGQHDMFAGFAAADQKWFARGMYANAVHGARGLLAHVDFSRFRSLLDIGGSAGGYALAVVRAHAELHATIFDLPAVRELAKARIKEEGLGDRVAFAGGSFFEPPLPPGHDCHLLSSILHDWGDADCARILRHSFDSIEAGGTVVVTEPMLADDSTGPDHPSVSGLLMAVLGGENRTRTRIGEMLRAAGYRSIRMSGLGLQNSVVTGVRPRA